MKTERILTYLHHRPGIIKCVVLLMVSRVSVAEAAPVVASSGAVLCRDSVKLRILEIEDLLSVQIEEATVILVRELDR